MRLGELLGREVVTESGERLGRVRDVQGELEQGRLRLTGLVAGAPGTLERLGVGPLSKGRVLRAKRHDHTALAWERGEPVGELAWAT